METADLNYDWLTKLLNQMPREIRHILVSDQPRGEGGSRVVLTASTPELQRFVLRYLQDTNAWNARSRWKRRSRP